MDEEEYSTLQVRSRAVRAVLRGRSMADVADACDTDRSTVLRWVRRYQQEGNDGLQRRPGSGRPRKLQELKEDELRELVLRPASDFGYETDLWTVGRLHGVICKEYHVVISKDTVWRRLREAGLTYQKPEREYYEIDEGARQKWIRYEVPKIRKTVAKHRAILYFQDEANVSLTAFLGKTWSPCGPTPKAKVTGKRGGVAAMSAISRRGHLLFRLHNKRIASPEVIDFLKQIYLPKYSPDWNPDEKIWNHLKHQELTRHQAKTKEELTKLTRRKLQSMATRPSLIRGIFFRCCVADLFG